MDTVRIETAEDYFNLVSTFDERQIEEAIARIPKNVNPTGKHYRKLVKKIYADYAIVRNARATKSTASRLT